MTIFVCEDSFEGVLTGVYDAWASHIHRKQLRIEVGPIGQREFFAEYVPVSANSEKTEKVMRSIHRKISYYAYRQCMYCALSAHKDRGDAIYRFLLLGFTYGAQVTKYLQEPSVMKVFEYSRAYGNEAHYYREFVRFSSWNQVYISHISPKGDVLSFVGDHFADRMPSEHFIIVDDVRKKAIIHPKNEECFLRFLTEEEFQSILSYEKKKDNYTDLWQTFFETIAIKERYNPTCQRNHLPLHFRKHMVEFTS
ncbi:MAG: TIGR03915 family putative DNA repair protein [Eubacteriales bacterium]|nr:TIGR03915 family putative DNA repair protein [Eubacteriales bacterium]